MKTTTGRAGDLFPASYGGDGYDYMDAIQAAGWHVFANWGEQGWDFGSWPYVIYAIPINQRHGISTDLRIMSYCEGDVTVYHLDNEVQWWAKLDELARWHWLQETRLLDRGKVKADPRRWGPYNLGFRKRYIKAMGDPQEALNTHEGAQ